MQTIDRRRIDIEPDEADILDPATSEDTDQAVRDTDEDRAEDETAPIGPDGIATDEAEAALDDKETSDGLDDLEESVRKAAEEAVTGDDSASIDKLPVFERGMLPPKV